MKLIILYIILTIILYIQFVYNVQPYDVVIQTSKQSELDRIPSIIEKGWSKYFKGTRILFNDIDCIRFLEKYYDQEYVDKYNQLKLGAHKADLFRYAWLYINGGIYCDIKTVLIKPLDTIFSDNRCAYFIKTGNDRIFNGIIATPPRNPIIFDLLTNVLEFNNDEHYLTIVTNGYNILSKYVDRKIHKGYNKTMYAHIPDFVMFEESYFKPHHCKNKLDRHNICSFMTDGMRNKLIKIREHTYPDW